MNGGELIILFAIIMSVGFLMFFCVGKVIGPERCETGGHRYQARYDELPNPCRMDLSGIDCADARELVIVRRYVRDVCVRCGKTIEREPKA